MGDKSPTNQIKIGNLTVKLNSKNQQKRTNYDYDNKNYHRDRDRHYDKYSDKYSNKYNEKYKGRSRDYEHNYHRNKNYRNKSRSRSRSKSKTYYPNKNKNHNSKSRSRSNSKNYSHHRNNNSTNNEVKDNNNMGNKQNSNNNISNNNNQQMNNQMQMNQMYQNYFNNYMNMNKDYFKNFCQMNNINPNNSNNVFIPVGIPINYFYKQNNNNKIPQNNNNNQNNNINQKEKEKEEPSNTILITDLDTNITKEILEEIFHEKCLKLEISLPIDIRLIEALNIAYVIFPSITSCVVVYNSLINQKLLINGKYYPIQFSPNLTQKYNNNRDTLTYVTQISGDKNLTTSMETTIHEDWYCIYCNSKNFSRRIVCFKCQKPKSINCRVVPVIKQKKIILGKNGEILPNNSIIIQGKQITCSNEGEVFIINLFIFINFSY
jgi:hypothetical protein